MGNFIVVSGWNQDEEKFNEFSIECESIKYVKGTNDKIILIDKKIKIQFPETIIYICKVDANGNFLI